MKTRQSIKVQGWVKALPLCLFTLMPLNAQDRLWSLSECEDYAVAHNITIKQKEKAVERQANTLSTARNSRLPDLNGTVGQNFNFGRGLTSNNVYENKNTTNTSFQLATSVPLFTGFQIPENIKVNRLNLEAVTADLEKAKQILYDMEIAAVAHRQVGIDSMQVVRLQALVDNGKASVSELSQQIATLASGRLTATQADNKHRMSVLTLTQLLELPSPDGFGVVTPTEAQLEHIAALNITNPEQIYEEAVSFKPEVRSQQLRLESTEHSIKVAKAGYYPKLNLNAGVGSNYYTVSGLDSDAFGEQLRHNFSQFIGLNLSIPIFNRFSVRNSVRNARVDRDNQQLTLDNTKKTLYKEIQQVYYNTLNAQAKERSSKEAVASSEDAFALMQAKYENGKANITEFNESKNKYLKAQSDYVQARYEHLYQRALLEFYRGSELVF